VAVSGKSKFKDIIHPEHRKIRAPVGRHLGRDKKVVPGFSGMAWRSGAHNTKTL
jgi:hypothetical protein